MYTFIFQPSSYRILFKNSRPPVQLLVYPDSSFGIYLEFFTIPCQALAMGSIASKTCIAMESSLLLTTSSCGAKDSDVFLFELPVLAILPTESLFPILKVEMLDTREMLALLLPLLPQALPGQ